MSLSFRSRIVGDVTVLQCDGSIVEGTAAAALRQHVTKALEHTPAIVLDLRGVNFIDSSGLGVLVRILARTGHDNLKLCGLTSRTLETLKITRLSTVFDIHETETDAIAAFYRQSSVRTSTVGLRCPRRSLCRQIARCADVYARSVAAGRIQRRDRGQRAGRSDAAQGDDAEGGSSWRRHAQRGNDGHRRDFQPPFGSGVSGRDVNRLRARDPRDTGPRLIEHVRGFIGHA